MLRIANPGSDIDSYVRIFAAIAGRFGETTEFDLDDMTTAMIDANLVSSCGHTGSKALALSTRADRSRDPLFNQSKMYSELFRVLGWISPRPDNRLSFSVTFLGRHVPACRRPEDVVKASLLGIAYPNESLDTKEPVVLRPFKTILTTMLRCQGRLCRDEMIVGPLSLSDDRRQISVAEMQEQILELRKGSKSSDKLEAALESLSKRRGISRVTMENYTRFPIGVLEWSGWARKERLKGIYGRPTVFLQLTEDGEALAKELNCAFDFRAADLRDCDTQTRQAVITLTGYRMLQRAGFDTTPADDLVAEAKKSIACLPQLGRLSESSALFSPFQELAPSEVSQCFPLQQTKSPQRIRPAQPTAPENVQADAPLSLLRLSESMGGHGSKAIDKTSETVAQIRRMYEQSRNSPLRAAKLFTERVSKEAQRNFYPLVADLLTIAGHPCSASRAGVNYQRFDALIEYPGETIPVEIKSPAEELHLSVKAVRQAAENKIIMLARGNYTVSRESCSLAVGYLLPADRSEVSSLIADIAAAFALRVAVLDFETLARMAITAACEGKSVSRKELVNSHGIIQVNS